MPAGETVLDLSSGCGIDVLPSACRVVPIGKAYGLDMVSDLFELAATAPTGRVTIYIGHRVGRTRTPVTWIVLRRPATISAVISAFSAVARWVAPRMAG